MTESIQRATVACRTRGERGFSLPELLIATAVLLTISGIVTTALMQMTGAQKTIWNRTEMHSGVRSATELLQQEVGQAGRIALPLPTPWLTANVGAGSTDVTVSSSSGMFVGELLTVDAGPLQETVVIAAINGSTITANAFTGQTGFLLAHTGGATAATGAAVTVYGGFSAGIVPCASQALCPGSVVASNFTNGSSGTVLKMFGDLNSDGNMLYAEYTCDIPTGNLYRNVMAWNAGAKPALTVSQVLLSNIVTNPGATACFTYQQQAVGGTTYVTDVAITLTVQTQQVDPVTKQFQKETKALLNVSPRNVFNVWELASQGSTNRVQSTPQNIITNLLP